MIISSKKTLWSVALAGPPYVTDEALLLTFANILGNTLINIWWLCFIFKDCLDFSHVSGVSVEVQRAKSKESRRLKVGTLYTGAHCAMKN